MAPTTRHDSKIQAKLDFSPLPKDSTQAQQLASSVRDRASAVRYYSPKKAKAAQITSTKTSQPRNDTKLKLRSGSKSKQQQLELGHRNLRSNANLPRIDEPISIDNRVYGSQLKSSSEKNLHSVLASSGLGNGGDITDVRVRGSSPPVDHSDENEDEDELPLPTGTRSRPQILRDDDDEDNDDLDVVRPSPRNRRIEQISDDDDGQLLPKTTLREQNGRKETISLVDSSKESADTTSEDELVLPSSSRLLRRSAISRIDSDDEDELTSSFVRVSKRLHEQTSSSPIKKRRLQQGPKPRKKTREEQDEEVLEDAQDLQDTTTLDQGLRSTSKLNEKKLARQRQLSKLAARRNKTGPITVHSSSSSEAEDLPLGKPYNDAYSDENSSQADSLIDDADLDAPSPASSTEEIRINRSIYDVHSALYYTIQQLLHLKFFPSAHDTTNAYYTTAHSLISKRLESYANQFISSIWRKDFTAALHARPQLTWPRNQLNIFDFCEVCGHRDHSACYVMRFEGPCYNEWALDSIDDDDDSSIFHKFDTQVPEDTVWHVGTNCHDNAWRAHRAVHWRYELARQISKALGMMGIDVGKLSDNTKNSSTHSEPHNEGQSQFEAEAEAEAETGGEEQHSDQADDSNQEKEDHFQAVLLQMEDQGYMQALQREFLERFEMSDDEDDD